MILLCIQILVLIFVKCDYLLQIHRQIGGKLHIGKRDGIGNGWIIFIGLVVLIAKSKTPSIQGDVIRTNCNFQKGAVIGKIHYV